MHDELAGLGQVVHYLSPVALMCKHCPYFPLAYSCVLLALTFHLPSLVHSAVIVLRPLTTGPYCSISPYCPTCPYRPTCSPNSAFIRLLPDSFWTAANSFLCGWCRDTSHSYGQQPVQYVWIWGQQGQWCHALPYAGELAASCSVLLCFYT